LSGQPLLSIIIVNHFAEDVLHECLAAIDGSDHDLQIEIIIVDNPAALSESSLSHFENLSIERIPVTVTIGFAAACNLGVSHSQGNYLLFLNPDVILDPPAIGALYSVLTDVPEAGIVVGRLVGADGEFQASCRRFPTLGNLIFSRGSLLGVMAARKKAKYTLPDYSEVTEVEAAAAAMMMIARSDFARRSGFDERFFLYMEDTDLCYRVRKKGIKVLYVPQASGKHYWGFSTGRYRFRRIIWHHQAIWKYFRKHHRSIPALGCLALFLLANCFLSLIIELFTLRK
jgi:GT2 family glycosyltransferase